MRFGFEWDLNGHYGFEWDFERGPITMRFGFEWDLEGVGIL